MQRTVVNLLVDMITGFALLGMILTGYVIKFPLPPGTNKSWMLWGLSRHQWGDIHFWFSIALLTLLLVHVCLHWHWITTVLRQHIGLAKPSATGIFPDALLAVVILGLSFLGFAVIAHLFAKPVPESLSGVCHDGALEVPAPNHQESEIERPSEPKTKPTWKDVYPILEHRCVGCHGPQTQRGGIRVDRVENLLSTDGKEGWIIPGQSAASPLIEIVSGRRDISFPNRHHLPAAEVTRLRAWIDSGAH